MDLEGGFGELAHHRSSFRKSDEPTVPDSSLLASKSLSNGETIDTNTTIPSAQFTPAVDRDYVEEQEMLMRHWRRSHATTIRSFIEIAKMNMWNKYAASYIRSYPDRVILMSELPAPAGATPSNSRPLVWGEFFDTVARDFKADPTFDMATFESFMGGKGPTHTHVLSEVVHPMACALLFNEIEFHADLVRGSEGVEEQRCLKALYKEVFGSYCSPF